MNVSQIKPIFEIYFWRILIGCAKEKECKDILYKYFGSVEEVILPSPFAFSNIDEICADLLTCIPGQEAFVNANMKKISEYFAKEIENGDVMIPHDGGFWRVRK